MTPQNFNTLTIEEKIHLVLEHGDEVTSRSFLYFNVKLYTLQGFFVEIWYVPSSNKIEKINLIEVDEILSLYKNSFDISELLN